MPLIPDLAAIREQMRQVLENLPEDVSMKDISIATGGTIQVNQLAQFRTVGCLGEENLCLLERVLEEKGLWPPKSTKGV